VGFGQWFYRLFAILAGLIVVQVAVTTILLSAQAGTNPNSSLPLWQLWLLGTVSIALGGVITWFAVKRMMQPLVELSQYVRAVGGTDTSPSTAIAHRDELGALAGVFDRMQRDLAERRDQMEDHAERLQTVLSSMAEGVLAVGPDKLILLANEAARQLLDFATPDSHGRSLLAVTRARPVYDVIAQALASPAPVMKEFDAPGPIRRKLALRATRLPGDPCPGVVVVLHDMTELRRLESLRRELVANVSHELKTPLAAIKGYAETLRLGAINDQDHNLHFVRRIEEQADRLHKMILDILQLARVESGQESFEYRDVSVANLLQQCSEQFAAASVAKQVELSIQPPPPSLSIYADEEGVQTILSNLVDNAIKYTSSGGRVSVGASEQDSFVALEVADTGVGIPEQHLERVFERFYRVDKARSSELGSTGLGLSIVKHLTQAFGGNVSVISQAGRGSTFRVELPRSPSRA
jgi:two-component system phosphate regulon sensor histidine kinase PhoR